MFRRLKLKLAQCKPDSSRSGFIQTSPCFAFCCVAGLVAVTWCIAREPSALHRLTNSTVRLQRSECITALMQLQEDLSFLFGSNASNDRTAYQL